MNVNAWLGPNPCRESRSITSTAHPNFNSSGGENYSTTNFFSRAKFRNDAPNRMPRMCV